MSGFDFEDEGISLAAVVSEESLYMSSSYADGDFYENVGVEMPKAKAIEFANWILAQFETRPEESIAKNAARYQWLKDANVDVMDEILMQKAEEWDSLIDTQIAFEERVPQERDGRT